MDVKKIYYIIEEKLLEIKTLIIGIGMLFIFLSSIDKFIDQFINFQIKSIIYLLLFFLWIIYWFFKKFHLPRNKRTKVGIVIAIFSENNEERQRLKADFILKLQDNFRQENMLNFSEIIFLKNHFSKQIMESNNPRNKLKKINKKIKAHFYVWGDIKKRKDGNEGEKYFLHFHGHAFHKPISKSLSQNISKDFSKVLPNNVNFLENISFKGFEASAEIVHLAARYIIGLVALISFNPRLALLFHKGLKEQFNIFKPLPPNIKEIKNRISRLMSDELLWIARWHFKNNRYNETKTNIENSLSENYNNYGTWLFRAIIYFLIDGNIDEAFKSIGKAEKFSKKTFEWRYSKAFLYFWKNDYQKALKLCRKIKKQNFNSEKNTLKEVREFNLNVLKENKTKVQLYFWIGYLSYFKQNNLVEALQDFENFEKLADESMNILKQKSSAYLQQIKKEMGIKD